MNEQQQEQRVQQPEERSWWHRWYSRDFTTSSLFQAITNFAAIQFIIKSWWNMWHGDNFIVAAKDGESSEVERLLKKSGANINYQDKDGQTALVQAIHQDRTNIIELLLIQPEIDVSIAENLFEPLLCQAACLGHTKIVNLLVDKFQASINWVQLSISLLRRASKDL